MAEDSAGDCARVGRQRCPAVIRPAQREDSTAILHLWQELMDMHASMDPRFRLGGDAAAAYTEQLKAMMKNSRCAVLVAVIGGRVVGYATAELVERPRTYPAGKYGFISELFVLGRYRRLGIGRSLARRALLWLLSLGATQVELLAAVNNDVSLAFWESIGFRPFLQLMRYDYHDPVAGSERTNESGDGQE